MRVASTSRAQTPRHFLTVVFRLLVVRRGGHAGCQDGLAIGGRWVHLRMCQTCGRIGCCDSSPHRHASAHAPTAGHPIARSAEPGEEWSWCYLDEFAFVIDRRR